MHAIAGWRTALVPMGAALLHQAPLQAETQFSIYTGTSRTRSSEVRLVQPGAGTDLSLGEVRWGADPFRPAPYYGLRLTHFPERAPNWGIALDFTHYKVYAKTDRTVSASGTWRGAPVSGAAAMNQFVQRFEISHGVNVLSVNGIYRWLDPGLASGRLQPYAGAGLAHYRPHAETTVDGATYETGYQGSGFGYQLLAGAQYRVAERWALFLETKFDSGTAKLDIAGGRAETPLRTFHLTAGIGFTF